MIWPYIALHTVTGGYMDWIGLNMLVVICNCWFCFIFHSSNENERSYDFMTVTCPVSVEFAVIRLVTLTAVLVMRQ